MSLTQLFEQIREHYLDTFRRAVRDRVRDPAAWLIEHTFGAPQPSEDGEDAPSLPMRHDLISLQNGQPSGILVVQSKTQPRFEQVLAEWQGIQLLVRPFTWDRCALLVQDLNEELGEQPFVGWFDRWFDVNGQKRPDDTGTLKVIHSALPSQTDEPGTMIIEVDFGTAPVAALTELIEAFREMGATSVVLCGPDEGADDNPEDR